MRCKRLRFRIVSSPSLPILPFQPERPGLGANGPDKNGRANVIYLAVHNLTDICWTKCVASNKVSGGALTGAEESCTRNCVDRFLDANVSVLRHLEMMRGGGGL